MLYKKVIVDADLCIKLGNSKKYLYLEKLLPQLADEIFIHEVVNHEILTNREQIDRLIKSGDIKILKTSELSATEKSLYDAAFDILARVMLNKNNPNKNRGEVSSLAMAKIKAIPYFLTDEKNLQKIIDANLNTGMDDIRCLRIIDVIEFIKTRKLPGFERIDAKRIWIISGKDKVVFDRVIWPVAS